MTTQLSPTEPTAHVTVEPPRRRGSSLHTSRNRFIAALVAPAIVFMLIVHLLPTIGGFYRSFKNLNLFTFRQLFDAPWAGLGNYEQILFKDNPLRSGFTNALGNTAIYTFWTVLGTLVGGMLIALLMNREMRGI